MKKRKIFLNLSLIFILMFTLVGSYLFQVQAKPEANDLGMNVEGKELQVAGTKQFTDSEVTTDSTSTEATDTAENISEENNLTLKEAIQEAINNNGVLKSLDHVIKAEQVGIREAKDAASSVSDMFEKTLDGGKVKYYLPYDAEIQYEIAKLDKLDQEDSTALTTMNAYVDALYTKESVEVLKSGVKRTQEQVDIAKVNYDVGTITKVDVLSSEVQLEDTKSDLEQAKHTLEIKKMQLNQVMNRSLTLPIEFESTDLSTEIPTLEEAIALGLENNISLKKQQLEVKSIDKLLEVVKMYHNENSYDYQSAYSSKMTKEAMIGETESQVELGIRSQDTKIKTLLEKHKVMEQQVEKVAETYDIMLAQYKAGLISYQELANQDQLLKQTSLEELQAKLDYYRAIYEYRYMIGLK